jgi:hypothetical protein
MGFALSLSNITGTSNTAQNTKGKTIQYGRVIDVILDEYHPQYSNKGGGISINGVFFKPLSSTASEVSATDLPFAYQPTAHLKVVPLIGEIIQVEPLPVPSDEDFSNKTRKYYTKVLNIWNNANNNFYPDILNNFEIDFSQGNRYVELQDVNPIGSSPGDVQLEGRQGQSIRFTGGKSISNPWIDSSNLGKPLLIISNGQKETDNGFTTIGEDINEDSSSIYMASDHKIPLTQASEKRDAYDEQPEKADQFKGNQVLITGGRLFFNAKERDIQLSSRTSIGLTTEGSINIDGSSYLCIDAPIMFLGAKARTSPDRNREAVLLGNQTEAFLENVLNLLEGMAKDMARAKTIKGHPIPAINKRGVQAQPVIRQLKNLINPSGPSQLKSKKVFTE